MKDKSEREKSFIIVFNLNNCIAQRTQFKEKPKEKPVNPKTHVIKPGNLSYDAEK